MKASKAVRRLAKIETLMSDVKERYVTLAPSIRKALQDAMVAVTIAKEAVTLEVSSGNKKNPPRKEPVSKKADQEAKSTSMQDVSPRKPVAKSSKKITPAKKVAPIAKAAV
jgi:hypothetical protein